MRVRLVPNEAALPTSGGVRQHCVMLRRFIAPLVDLTDDHDAFTHVQSSYMARRCDVYTCHGGFLPAPPIQGVLDNLHYAKRIISVAKWIVDDFFPLLAHKTTVIPNGVSLSDWDAVPEGESGFEPGYILVKGYMAWPEHWQVAVEAFEALPDHRFVSVGWPPWTRPELSPNLTALPVPIPEPKMARIIRDCAAFVSPSSEVNPVMAMEAMTCGKPVFGLDFHGNKEVIMQDLRYSSAAGLVWLVKNMFAHLSDDYWGKHNRWWVETHHNWEHLAHDILAVYEDAAQQA